MESHLKYCVDQNSTYRRRTSLAVWYHRFLAAHVQNFKEEIMITGIDMTSVFDTINPSFFNAPFLYPLKIERRTAF